MLLKINQAGHPAVSGNCCPVGTDGSEILQLSAADPCVKPLGIGGRSQKVRVVEIARQESQDLFELRFGDQSTARGIQIGERSAFPPIGAELPMACGFIQVIMGVGQNPLATDEQIVGDAHQRFGGLLRGERQPVLRPKD